MSTIRFLFSYFILLSVSFLARAEFPLQEATIDNIHANLTQGKYSCEKVMQLYLDRIKGSNFAMNKTAPLNAFVSINENILQQAKRLDNYYQKNKKLKGTLHCIPVVVKDNIDTYDSPTSAGTLALLGSQPVKDAFVVKKLREAGAVIIGKSTMDELAAGRHGISSRSGRTGNAYDTTRSPGGSSSGSAVAVSANFVVIGLGTDNNGSIRIPAAYNGLYALRPSSGLVSQSGVFPLGNVDGAIGPMARSTRDLALVLNVIAQRDPQDKKTGLAQREKSYLPQKTSIDLKGLTIGVLTRVNGVDQFRKADPSVRQVYKHAIGQFKKLGAKVVNNIELTGYNTDRKNNRAGEREEVDAYLSSFPGSRKNYKELCQSGRLLVTGGIQACLKEINELPPLKSKESKKALEIFENNRSYIKKVMEDHHLDMLLAPVDAKGIPAKGHQTDETINCIVASNAGLPVLTFIAGVDPSTKLPIALELIGRQFDEKLLIHTAAVFEKQQPRPVPEIARDESHLAWDIPQMNNLITLNGESAFEQYLKKGGQQALNADNFAQIVQLNLAQLTK